MRTENKIARLSAILAILFFVMVVAPYSAQAGTTYWIGGTDNWSNGDGWSPRSPVPGDNADLAEQLLPATVNFDSSLYSSASSALGSLNIGSTSGDVVLNHSSNTLYTGTLVVDNNGTYNLSQPDPLNPATLAVTGTAYIGQSGTGTFNHGSTDGSDSPTVTVAGDLVLGQQASGNGTYNQYGGFLTVGVNEYVGQTGTGYFTQTGGTATITGQLNIGTISTPTSTGLGYYELDGGSLTVGQNEYVGDAGAGFFTQTGGTHTASGNLVLGNQSSGTGHYNITGNSTVLNVGGNGGNPNGALIVGNGGDGFFTQGTDIYTDPNNQVNVAGDLVLGQQQYTLGTYTLNSGALTVGGKLVVGGQGTGTFTQSGGTNTISGVLDLGYQSGHGTYNLSGGSLSAGTTLVGDGWADFKMSFGPTTVGSTLTISGNASLTTGDMWVGLLNQGTVNQSGGFVTAASLNLGWTGTVPNASGYYNLTGTGQLTVSGAEIIGWDGYGQVTQGAIGDGGGTNNTVGGDLVLGSQANISPNTGSTPRAGVYTLNSGILTTADTIVGSLGEGTFTQNGGTHTVANNLVIGDQTSPLDYTCGGGSCIAGGPSQGTYNMNGGTLTAQNVIIGNAGNGTFTQTGGSVTVAKARMSRAAGTTYC